MLARMGRTGWLKVYFGRGQHIELADGTDWRLRSIDIAGDVCPVIVDTSQRKIALASPLTGGGYGINGKNFAHVLYPFKKAGLLRSGRWILRDRENDIAVINRRPLSAITSEPVHTGSVLLAFALVKFGLPSEKKPALPAMKW